MVKKILSMLFLLVVIAFLYMPIVMIIIFSFSNRTDFTFANGFNFDAYISIFTDKNSGALLQAFKNTILIAVISSVVSTVLGTSAAIGINRLGKRMKRIVNNVNQLPVINSEVVMAVSLMVFFVTFKFPEGYLRLILGHIAFSTPYVVLNVMPKLVQMDNNVYEAALDLGATPVRALTSVVLPIISPGIVSGFLLAFTLSMDDFIITQINKGATTGIDTLSTYIYSDARIKGLSPYWFAVFSIIFVVVLAVVLFINLRKKSKGSQTGGIIA
ncbi:MAG: ABC transporter permease [Clostridia bacterium]|nr:ABC transporter permease [Clostridia bacterium]